MSTGTLITTIAVVAALLAFPVASAGTGTATVVVFAGLTSLRSMPRMEQSDGSSTSRTSSASSARRNAGRPRRSLTKPGSS
jgi:hypothetical protein